MCIIHPEAFFAKIPSLLAKRKCKCTGGTFHETENIVNIGPKCEKHYSLEKISLENKIPKHLAMKAICNFFGKK